MVNGIIRFSPFARDWPYYCFTDPKAMELRLVLQKISTHTNHTKNLKSFKFEPGYRQNDREIDRRSEPYQEGKPRSRNPDGERIQSHEKGEGQSNVREVRNIRTVLQDYKYLMLIRYSKISALCQ
jgi:hypothetical protein